MRLNLHIVPIERMAHWEMPQLEWPNVGGAPVPLRAQRQVPLQAHREPCQVPLQAHRGAAPTPAACAAPSPDAGAAPVPLQQDFPSWATATAAHLEMRCKFDALNLAIWCIQPDFSVTGCIQPAKFP